jgi:tRNA threonylcarbamoyladenosine biosynthesis protein TsaE
MATCISHSPAETEALGETWGREAKTGWIIALSGDLGAGKTQLVKGLARGLEIPMRVHSPTFTLVNVYTGGRLTLFHLDLYRLDTPEQIIAAGLEEYLHPAGVTVIEWAEKWFGDRRQGAGDRSQESGVRSQNGSSPARDSAGFTTHFRFFRSVYIETLGETERRITYEDSGP